MERLIEMNMHLTILLLLFFSVNTANANIIRVGKKNIATITEAIAIAKRYDTIFVEKGIYKEHNLVIDKPVYLMGLDKPLLDGESKYEIISVKADSVTVDGFRLQHSAISSIVDYAGIKIYNKHKVTIINNILEDTFFGVYVQYGIDCVIKNNTLVAHQKEEQQSGNGIHCWKSDSIQIINNTVSGHRDGIYFEFVTHSLIWRNFSHENLRYGLHFMFSNDDTYITNTFEGNGSGVSVMFSHGVKMFNNLFRKNWGDGAYGILFKEISDSYGQGNIFENNTTGVYMEGASRIDFQKNTFKHNGWALKIQASCMDINLHHNNFIANTFDVATNGSLVLNNFNENYWDKYEGYDLNKDKFGDVPYHPVSMYSMIIEKNPTAVLLFRSFITSLMDKTEKIMPGLTPENLKDNRPLMKPVL